MVIFWGTQTNIKRMGFHGDKKICGHCNHEYIPYYYRITTFDHFCAIPVTEKVQTYRSVCPICGNTDFVQNFRFTEIADTVVTAEMQNLSYIAVQKEKRKYDFVVKDNLTQEQMLIARNIPMRDIKDGILKRGGRTKDLIIVV